VTRALVLGGNRSGKSAFAEHLLADEPTVDYIATSARSGDRDWEDRVRRHQQRRPSTWRTIETADVARELRVDSTPALIDSVTAWLTRTMDECRYWADELAETSARDLDDRLDEFDQAWEATTRRVASAIDPDRSMLLQGPGSSAAPGTRRPASARCPTSSRTR